jgi:hypothetical protein
VADNAHTRGEQKNWKTEKIRKKITEKTEPWKKPIKPIKILKKQAGSVRFRFYKSKTEKTEPNRTQTKKTEPNRQKTEPKWKNRAKPVWTGFCPEKIEPKPVGLHRFSFGYFFI